MIPVMLGGHSGLDPPLPISNRAVKRTSANDSMLLACESRSLPSYLYPNTPHANVGVFLFVLPENTIFCFDDLNLHASLCVACAKQGVLE